MIIRKIWIIATLLIVLVVSVVQAKDDSPKINKLTSKEPIEIVANRMDAYNDKKMVIFSGNAVATQGDREIKSDRLILYYKKQAGKKETTGVKAMEGTGDLEKIEAKGHVVVTQKERVATGDEAVYYQDSGQIIMTGNATLRDGKNTIKGDKVIVFVNENRGVVESKDKKRVKAIIYPQEKSEEKKKK